MRTTFRWLRLRLRSGVRMVVDASGLAVLLWQGWLYFDSIAHMCALICAVIIGLVRSRAPQLSIAAVHRSCIIGPLRGARSASSAAAHVC